MLKTAVYRLTPAARPEDPNWGRALNQGEVVVRAWSAGDARIVAAYAEAEAITLKIPEGTTRVAASAFRDSRLYHVARDGSGEFPDEGPRGVLRALFQVPPEPGAGPTLAQDQGVPG